MAALHAGEVVKLYAGTDEQAKAENQENNAADDHMREV